MVNQLEYVTKSLDFMDRHVTEHEQIIEKLENLENTEKLMNEMDDRKLLVSEVYCSAWEAERKFEKKAEELEKEIEEDEEDDE